MSCTRENRAHYSKPRADGVGWVEATTTITVFEGGISQAYVWACAECPATFIWSGSIPEGCEPLKPGLDCWKKVQGKWYCPKHKVSLELKVEDA